MQKQIWYGVKNDQVQFAEEPDTLQQVGIANPQSFTVDGRVDGLSLIGDNNLSHTGAHTQRAS